MTIALKALHGRVLDIDSHEQVPASRMEEMFGERGKRFAAVSPSMQGLMAILGAGVRDDEKITEQTVWENKLLVAPSHADMDRRPAVLDMMGIQRQLVFPTMALVPLSQALGGLHIPSTEEEQEAAWGAIDAYNEWAAHLTSKYPKRLYVVALLCTTKPGVTPNSLVKEAERLIKLGVRGVFIPTGKPPVGLSPADPALDLFYATLAEANVPLLTHPPGGVGYQSNAWSAATRGATWVHASEENFLAAMVAGGVFERHPTLRFGAIECGASWVGPLADYLDFWTDTKRRPENSIPIVVGNTKLSMRPSEYINRNVRVTPHNFEPVEVWFQRYPHLQDVYCYSSDFPHEEGQRWSLRQFYENVAPLGDKIIEKFFCANAQLLLP